MHRTIGRALVTGGAGFIGSNLVSALCQEALSVTVLDNLQSGHRDNLKGLDVRFFQSDIRNSEAVRTCDGAL